ncbi:heterokaryon incompatibility protein-domain-containing protein [Leptodontidium sp. 2 PMI_412]|nr:heterokaryon incompatibility protein-domain-containing protein [Leptodontidium sp. 2 PMI_412]
MRSHLNCNNKADSLKIGILQGGLQLVKTAIGIEKLALSGDYFKLIDVSEKHIVELPLQKYPQYFTLSYVWGSDNSNCQLTKDKIHWTQDGKGRRWTPLPGLPPATILDAKKAVETLGYRYLWVDSLCITQDDPVETQLQIQQMASIYANAVICIVAAAGLSPRTGLTGVSSSRKDLRSIARINGNIVLGAFLPNFRRIVMETKWGSRAWTY